MMCGMTLGVIDCAARYQHHIVKTETKTLKTLDFNSICNAFTCLTRSMFPLPASTPPLPPLHHHRTFNNISLILIIFCFYSAWIESRGSWAFQQHFQQNSADKIFTGSHQIQIQVELNRSWWCPESYAFTLFMLSWILMIMLLGVAQSYNFS